MNFPDTVDEFMEKYKIVDSEQIYTNGAELVPIFRMKQWFEHIQSNVDVVPIRHGRWIHDGFDFPHGNDWIHCSECGKRGINVPADLTNYCPNCGASMTEGAEE